MRPQFDEDPRAQHAYEPLRERYMTPPCTI